MSQPVKSDVPLETLTIEDLKASIGKGPRLDSGDIANTYYNDEEFLNAFAAAPGR